MGKYNDHSREEKPFNMAVLLLERLNLRLEESNQASINAEVMKWYRALRTLKSSIIFKVDEDEQKQLTKLFNTLRGKILVFAQQRREQEFYFDIEEDLIAFEELIIKLMYKYELYYPHYQKLDPFDLLEQEYS